MSQTTNVIGLIFMSLSIVLLGTFLILLIPNVIGEYVPESSGTIDPSMAFTDNAFNFSSMPDVVYNDDESKQLTVTRELLKMLAQDYPCANEQMELFTQDNVVAPLKVVFTTKTEMMVEYPSLPSGTYAIHTHPLQYCGSFNGADRIGTIPSKEDMEVWRRKGIDTAIIATKISNSTARISITKGLSYSDSIDKFSYNSEIHKALDDNNGEIIDYMHKHNMDMVFFIAEATNNSVSISSVSPGTYFNAGD